MLVQRPPFSGVRRMRSSVLRKRGSAALMKNVSGTGRRGGVGESGRGARHRWSGTVWTGTH